MIAACVGLRCLWNAFSARIQANEPNIPKQSNGSTTPSFQVASTTDVSFALSATIIAPPIINTAKDVEDTAIGSKRLVIESV